EKGAEYLNRPVPATTIQGREAIMKFIHALAASIFTACLVASVASAQNYPNRPVTMLVAFPPGGADDATARILHAGLPGTRGQSYARPLPRRRSGTGRPASRPSGLRADLGCRRAAAGRFRQAQSLRGYQQKAVRRAAEAQDHDPTRL